MAVDSRTERAPDSKISMKKIFETTKDAMEQVTALTELFIGLEQRLDRLIGVDDKIDSEYQTRLAEKVLSHMEVVREGSSRKWKGL